LAFWIELQHDLETAPDGLYIADSQKALLNKIKSPAFRNFTDPTGHLTGSAVIVDSSKRFLLLIFHPKAKRWLQPGGHIDAGESAYAAAQRESFEECGLTELTLVSKRPIDVDVHEIPSGKDPAHRHYDLRYFFVCPEVVSEEREWQSELKCRWVALEKVDRWTDEESVLRLARKALLEPLP
jgi:8-oxo-dGTP pyrophosphatase MutT (NUDIX family)